jgi:hypothetical protein
MKDGVLGNRMCVTFAVVVCAGLLSINVGLAADDSDTSFDAQQQDYYQKNDIAELQGRADAAIKEVNETALAAREKAEAVKRDRYLEDLHEVPSGSLLSEEELAEIEKQRAENEKAIRTRVEQELKSLEEQRALATEAIETGQAVESQPRLPTPAPTAGTVTGIVFCENKGAALLFGDIVRENDVIRGVRVLKILPDYVEFEKQDKKWKQMVGQTPPTSVWQQQPPPARQSSTNPKPKPKASR